MPRKKGNNTKESKVVDEGKSTGNKKAKVISVNTPYDDAFRTLLNDCLKLLIPVVNEVFGKNYSGDEEIVLHHNEHFIHNKSGDEEKRVTDSFFTIAGDKYMVECQSTKDNSMIVRIFEYAVHAALDTADTLVNDTLEITIPHTAVLYLRSDNTTPSKMKILIHTPDGDLKFYVPIMKMKDYTLDSLFEKKLYFLLPFFVFNHENNFKQYDSDPYQLEELKQEYVRMLKGLEQARASGELYQIDVRSIITMSRKVIVNLAAQFENVKKGVDSVMGGRILEYEGKTIFNEGKKEGLREGEQKGIQKGRKEGRLEGLREGEQKGINQTNERVATDMLLKKKFSISVIAEISKLSEDVVRGIAKSIGVRVVG